MDTCLHNNCEIAFGTKPEQHTPTTHKNKRASKPFGKPPFTNDDVYLRGDTFALHMVLPNGTEMTPCHLSEFELLKIANSSYTLLASLYSEEVDKKNQRQHLYHRGSPIETAPETICPAHTS